MFQSSRGLGREGRSLISSSLCSRLTTYRNLRRRGWLGSGRLVLRLSWREVRFFALFRFYEERREERSEADRSVLRHRHPPSPRPASPFSLLALINLSRSSQISKDVPRRQNEGRGRVDGGVQDLGSQFRFRFVSPFFGPQEADFFLPSCIR